MAKVQGTGGAGYVGGGAVFLDRDGTINEDPGYLNHPDQLRLIPKVGEALSKLKKAGFLLIVVSNQSGVGRGLIQESDIPFIHQRLDELLSKWGVQIDRYQLCFHRPDQECECRKPKAKMVLDAAQALQVDISRSYFIGDKISDLLAGQNAGCKASILVKTGAGVDSAIQLSNATENSEPTTAAEITDTLQEVFQIAELSKMARLSGGAWPAFIANSLLEAADWILAQENAGS